MEELPKNLMHVKNLTYINAYPQETYHLTIKDVSKSLGQQTLGLFDVLSRTRSRVQTTIKTHFLQHINIIVQFKCIVKTEDILRPSDTK